MKMHKILILKLSFTKYFMLSFAINRKMNIILYNFGFKFNEIVRFRVSKFCQGYHIVPNTFTYLFYREQKLCIWILLKKLSFLKMLFAQIEAVNEIEIEHKVLDQTK